jgi:hypothetical protein
MPSQTTVANATIRKEIAKYFLISLNVDFFMAHLLFVIERIKFLALSLKIPNQYTVNQK